MQAGNTLATQFIAAFWVHVAPPHFCMSPLMLMTPETISGHAKLASKASETPKSADAKRAARMKLFILMASGEESGGLCSSDSYTC